MDDHTLSHYSSREPILGNYWNTERRNSTHPDVTNLAAYPPSRNSSGPATPTPSLSGHHDSYPLASRSDGPSVSRFHEVQDSESLPMIGRSHLGDPYHLHSGFDSSPSSPRPSIARSIGDGAKRTWWGKYERPQYWLMGVHTIGCIVGFPIVYYLPKAMAQGHTLFWARVIVGAVCSVVGLTLGVTLLYLGRRGIEAAVWATIAHAAATSNGGLSLKEVAFQADPGPLSAVVLLFRRLKSQMHKASKHDHTLWGGVIVLFLVVSIIAASLTFFLGRTVDIGTWEHKQWTEYSEATVAGDLSAEDIEYATRQVSAFSSFVRTWTLGTYSSSSQLPAPIKLTYNNPQTKKNESVYFSDTFPDQIKEGGSGFGTFKMNTTRDQPSQGVPAEDLQDQRSIMLSKGERGRIIRWPRWGIRIACARVPTLDKNVVLSRNSTIMYTFIPRSVLSSLFESLGIPYPSDILDAPLNETALWQYETPPGRRPVEVPEDFDPKEITQPGTFWDTGLGHSFKSAPLTMGAEGYGWRQIETTLIRHDTTMCPQASFGKVFKDVLVPDDIATSANQTFDMGVDVGVCLEVLEPWIVEAYSAPGAKPVTTILVGKGTSIEEGGVLTVGKKVGSSSLVANASRALNSSGKSDVWIVVHDNSRNVVLKDNGRDQRYSPSPTSVSFTLGHGPEGYLSLDADALGQAFAVQDATNLLPYLSGSQPLLAQSYADTTLATVQTSPRTLPAVLVGVWALGMIAAIFVPRLPFGEPRRDFSPVTWLVALGLGEDEHREAELIRKARRGGAQRQMGLEELEKRLGDLKVR